MENPIYYIIVLVIISIILVIAILLALKVYKLNQYVAKTKQEIENLRLHIAMSDVANDHVGIEQLEKITMKAEMASFKSHHLDNFGERVKPLLNYIISNTKQLAEGNLPEEERVDIGRGIESGSDKLTNMIENVLVMARADSDSISFDMATHNVGDIVEGLFEEFSNADTDKYREVENKGPVNFSIGKGIPMKIQCDRLYLEKAITEVVKNAFQFIEQGSIQIGWFYRMTENEVEIFVEDNGIGIKDEHLSLAFEPFFKGDESYTGAGIGLTIAESLIRKMGGSVRISSRGDFGTRVSILFQSVK